MCINLIVKSNTQLNANITINLIVKSNTQLNANITKIMLDKKTNISKWLCLKIIAQLLKKKRFEAADI